MKGRWIGLLLACILAVSCTGCAGADTDVNRILSGWDRVTEWLAGSQFTPEDQLIGQRRWGADRYQGSYEARCRSADGRDVIFGGASIYERGVRVRASAGVTGGTATLRLRVGDGIQEYLLSDQPLELTFEFMGGANYVMVDYRDFTGTVTLSCRPDES